MFLDKQGILKVVYKNVPDMKFINTAYILLLIGIYLRRGFLQEVFINSKNKRSFFVNVSIEIDEKFRIGFYDFKLTFECKPMV